MFSTTAACEHMRFLARTYGRYNTGQFGQISRHKNAAFTVNDGWLYILGTDDKDDMYQNLKGIYEPGVHASGGRAHSGFAEHADTVVLGLKLEGHDPEGLQGVVGHSLGGAAAQIIGARYGLRTLTFGSPRVWKRGSPPKEAKAGYTHTRVWNRSDIIVAVPTRLRWEHFEDSRISFGPSWYIGMFWRFIGRKSQIYHHLPDTYVQALDEECKKG